MNKAESKYFNTARLMDQALLLILEKKDLEFITVKEICQKAGVNRSTFYLHYENIADLFNETIEMLNKDFQSSFKSNNAINIIKNGSAEDSVFIKEEYLVPYLEFVKNNKKILQIIHKRPTIFNNEAIYKQMTEEIFNPILLKFNVPEKEIPYRLEYFTRGVAGIISKWLELNCQTLTEDIVKLIIDCVGFEKNKK